jgi:dihydrofolate reductase
MRKLIVLSFVTLDGVAQAPGGPEEDQSGGFAYGGWVWPYWDDVLDEAGKHLQRPYDLLLGRKTYQMFATFWPQQDNEANPTAAEFNSATKYVASTTLRQLDWSHSTLLEGDVAEAVAALKAQDGPDLQVHGSGNLLQTLLKHDLVDELLLSIFPITLGTGQRLFADGTIPAAFTVRDVKTSTRGVIIASYERAGAVQTASMG